MSDPVVSPAAPQGSVAKADLGKRFVAALIDGILAGIISFVPLGGFIGAAYMLLRDGLEFDFMKHRSIGKQVMKLHLVTDSGAPMDILTSVKRNWMFAFGGLSAALFYIPVVGWMLIPFVSLAAAVIGIIESSCLPMLRDGGSATRWPERRWSRTEGSRPARKIRDSGNLFGAACV
jgi:uncharacterized RDD family membrane protein YckC